MSPGMLQGPSLVRSRAPQSHILTMPSGNADRSQQGVGSSTGFPGSGLYPNHDIWGSRGSSATRNQSAIGTLSSGPDSDGSPTSFVAPLNSNPEVDQVWSSRPWGSNPSPRPVSASPNRTRNGLANGGGLFDQGQNVIGRPNGAFDNDTNGFPGGFASLQRPQDSFMESLASRNSASRDSSLAPSRPAQQSSTLPDRYRKGHTPSNSIHSQRAAQTQISGMPSQSGNARAFNANSQIDSDLSARLRQASLVDSTGIPDPHDMMAQPFQFNPISQPFRGPYGYDAAPTYSDNFGQGSYFGNLGSTSRHSPASSQRIDPTGGSRNYNHTPDSLAGSRRPSRDHRAFGLDAQQLLYQQQYAQQQGFRGSFDFSPYANQYALSGYNHLNSPHQQPMIPTYALPNGIQSILSANTMESNPRRGGPDPAKAARSALLEEFRHSHKSSRKYELKDIYGHITEFTGDQHGSRFIQQKLETANSDEKDQVFREIEENALQLMRDVFGNYVVQKLFEHGNQIQKKMLAQKMQGKVAELSVQTYACRVVQKALEHVLVEQQAELTKELEPDIIRVIKDQNGNHVVQKVIELVPRQYLDFIMNNLRGQVQTLATHTYGCRVIQRVLEHGTEEDKSDIMKELHSSIQMLITDQFGNYVAQHVIVNGKPEDSQRFIKLVLDNFIAYSKHKFASNVVEKCIECATSAQRTEVRELLSETTSDGTSNLQHMIRDQFGNYVIQKLVAGLQGEEREMFVEEIKPQFFQLKKTNGNSKQLQAMEKLLGVSGMSVTASSPRADRNSASGDINSKSPTPNLTNNTNSPQSSSPPSTHASAVEVPVEGATKTGQPGSVTGVSLQLQESES